FGHGFGGRLLRAFFLLAAFLQIFDTQLHRLGVLAVRGRFQVAVQSVYRAAQLTRSLVHSGNAQQDLRARRKAIGVLEFPERALVVALLKVGGARLEMLARQLVFALSAYPR